MNDYFLRRINNLKIILQNNFLDAFLITNLSNIFYLTGFTGSSAAVILTKNYIFLITDGRYKFQAEKECNSLVKIIIHDKFSLFEYVTKIFNVSGFKRIAYESNNLFVSDFLDIKNEDKYKLLPFNNTIEQLRYIKDEHEIKIIKEAIKITEKVFIETLNYIKENRTEIDVAIYMEVLIKKYGASCPSFNIIVASGINGSFPHAKPTNKKLAKGEFITIDFGIKYKNYCTDMTRTIALGQIKNEKLLEIYDTVLQASNESILSIDENITFCELDNISRYVINKKNYSKYFNHSLGHGIGIDVHEYPKINFKNKHKIKNNTLFTVEPGIYIPNLGGVRIEDMILMYNNKYSNMINIRKNLIEL